MRTASLYRFFTRLGKYFSSPRNILEIVLVPVVFFYSNGDRLWGLEDKALRWWSNIAASPRTNLMATVVGIDSSDYKNIFNETSPLNSDALKKAIERILQFEPAVLGVDIETSHESFATIKSFAEQPSETKIIWARLPELSEDKTKIKRASGILGTKLTSDTPDLVARSGLATVVSDAGDSIPRRYKRNYPTSDGPVTGFAWMIAQAYKPIDRSTSHYVPGNDFDNYNIVYTGIRPSYSLGQILNPQFGGNADIKGRIVLLGGRYEEGDKNPSPSGSGEIDGVDVVANIIETELTGRAAKSLSDGNLILIGALQLICMLTLFHHYTFLKACGFGLLLALGAGLASWLLLGFQVGAGVTASIGGLYLLVTEVILHLDKVQAIILTKFRESFGSPTDDSSKPRH